MKRLALLLLVTFSMTTLWALDTDSVTINFQLASKTKGETATLIYVDFVTCDQVALFPTTDSNGRWSVKIPSPYSLNVSIWDSNKIMGVVWGAIYLYLRPGKQADILLDDINDRCVFTGENAEFHNIQLKYPLKLKNFHGQMFDIGMQEAYDIINYNHEVNTHNIDSLKKNNPDIPSKYIKALRQRALFTFAIDMSQNLKFHAFDNMVGFLTQDNKLPKEYLDILQEIETKELLRNKDFLSPEVITYYNDIITLEDWKQNGFISEVKYRFPDKELNTFSNRCDVINSINASNEIKEMMKAGQFLKSCKELTPKRDAFLWENLSGKTYQLITEHIKNLEKQHEAITQEEKAVIDDTPLDSLADGKEIFQKLISPYRGRVVYVDIWGTWCGPCREQMDYLPQMHDALKSLPVTYMYLANRSPEELWQKSSKHYGLDGEDCANYRLPANQQSAVEEYLKVQAFPTYILVAPDGSIISNDAPRPSNAQHLKEQIQNILK